MIVHIPFYLFTKHGHQRMTACLGCLATGIDLSLQLQECIPKIEAPPLGLGTHHELSVPLNLPLANCYSCTLLIESEVIFIL